MLFEEAGTVRSERLYGPAATNLQKQNQATVRAGQMPPIERTKLEHLGKTLLQIERDVLFGPPPIPTLGVVVLLISPRPAERPRFSKFAGTYNSKAYSDYKKRLVATIQAKIFEGKILLPADYAGLTADFYLPIPKSWSGKEKARAGAQMHRKKPDADNYLKALSDALEEAGVFVNDGQVAQMVTRKWYVAHPANGEHLPEDKQPRIELRLHTQAELISQSL